MRENKRLKLTDKSVQSAGSRFRQYKKNTTKNKRRHHGKKQFRKKTHKKFQKIPFDTPHEVKPINCSPAVDGNTVNESSCLTPEVLVKLKNEYNNKHPRSLILSNNPAEIWQILKDRLKQEKGCKTEKCWFKEISDVKAREEFESRVFAPEQPPEWKMNPDEWLSNFDIFNVIWQYQEKYPDFKFMGPTTIDFDSRLPEKNGQCVENDLCQFDLKTDVAQGIQHFACVFNLDKSWQSGSHWVSIFIDIPEKIIFFFDSAGAYDTPKEIDVLVERIKDQGHSLKPSIDFKYYSNTQTKHQKGNTECGMYSIFFIITMLTGKTPFYKDRVLSMKERIDLFLKNKIPDEVVFDYRDLYFNKVDE